MQVLCCVAYESSVIVYHAKEPLEFLDGGRSLLLADNLDAVREWGNTMLVHLVTEKV